MDDSLKVVFMGTPAYAVPVLSALLDSGCDVVGVYTQPDRLAGRGRKRLVSAGVKEFAVERGLSLFQPASLRRDEAARRELASLSPDVIVVAAYGLFLPADVLDLPRRGCLNVHPSLLPRYRGASPVASAILNGDDIIGATIMLLDQGMDTGPIIAQQETPTKPDETTEDLTTRLFQMGAGLLLDVLPRWESGEIQARSQDDSWATVTSRLSKEDGEIDWNRPAAYIARQVRAYHPWPGAYTRWQGRLLKVIEARAGFKPAPTVGQPGQVLSLPEGGIGIGTSEGVLIIQRLQLEGRRAVSSREFVQGQRDFVGSRVEVG